MDFLTVLIVTWNVATKLPMDGTDVGPIIWPQNLLNEENPDFFVIGIQESSSTPYRRVKDAIYGSTWMNKFTNLLSSKGYARLKNVRLQGTILNVYCLHNWLPVIRNTRTSNIATGFHGLFGNKGGAGVSFNIKNTSFCFINTHLPAHEGTRYLEYRKRDFRIISDNFKDNIDMKDYIFWFGDLNFRLNKKNQEFNDVINMIRDKQYSELLKYDELRDAMKNDDYLKMYNEQIIDFPPTYKYKIDTSTYAGKRIPSYTDRVLYKLGSNNSGDQVERAVHPVFYQSLQDVQYSDHKPVIASFKLTVTRNKPVLKFQHIEDWINSEMNNVTIDLTETKEKQTFLESDIKKGKLVFYNASNFKLNHPVSTFYIMEISEVIDQGLKIVIHLNYYNFVPDETYIICYIQDNDVLGISNQFKVSTKNK